MNEIAMAPAPLNKNDKRSLLSLGYGLLCLTGFLLLFQEVYRVMYRWWLNDDYNYCFFIAPVALYLLWEKRESLRSIPRRPSWAGLAALMMGVVLSLLGELGGEFYSIYLGSWLVLVGFLLAHHGWGRVKAAAFPLGFLIAMFPFPNFLNYNLTLKLKLLSSQLGVYLMRMYGMSAFRDGNMIDLGFTKLQVVDACSGIRFLFPLIVLAMLLAYFSTGAAWKKWLLVLSAIPISLFTNSVRIASVGILYQFFGPVVAEGFFHDFSGWFIFMCSLVLLLLERSFLARLKDKKEVSHQELVAPSPLAPPLKGGFPWQQLSILLCLALAIPYASSLDLREKVPAVRPLAQFPLALPGWQGTRTAMEREFLDELKFDDYVMADYRDPAGKVVSFYTAYYASQTKGGSIHSPSSCLPGNGWIFHDSGDAAFAAQAGQGELRVNRTFMEKGGSRNLTYYWFPKSGRMLTSLPQLKLYTVWDALTSRRTDGALVRVITPVYQSEGVAEADARLQEFTRRVTPELAKFLPR